MFGPNRRHFTNEGGTEVVLGGAVHSENGEWLHALLRSLLVDQLASCERLQTHHDSLNVCAFNGRTTHIVKGVDIDLKRGGGATNQGEEEAGGARKAGRFTSYRLRGSLY